VLQQHDFPTRQECQIVNGNLNPLSATTNALNALKDLPLWLLTAVAAWLLLVPVFPSAGELLPPPYLGWTRLAGYFFALLAVCRFGSVLIPVARAWCASRKAPRTLHLTPEDHQSFWHVEKQPDGSLVTQFELRFMAKNLTNVPLYLLRARLIRPKIRGELIQDMILVRHARQNVYGSAHASGHYIPPNGLLPISVGIYIRGTPKQTTARMMRVLVGVTDADGNETRIKLDLKWA
jgi:hypothetical protein